MIHARAEEGDTLLDFEPGQDRLLLTGFAEGTRPAFTRSGEHTLLTLPHGQVLSLRHVQPEQLRDSDWQLLPEPPALDLLQAGLPSL